jgi:hypothetical protein
VRFADAVRVPREAAHSASRRSGPTGSTKEFCELSTVIGLSEQVPQNAGNAPRPAASSPARSLNGLTTGEPMRRPGVKSAGGLLRSEPAVQ